MKHLLLPTIAAVVLVGCAITVEIGSRTSAGKEEGAEKESNDDGKAVSGGGSSSGSSSRSSSSTGSSSVSRVVKDSNKGELHYKKSNGEASLKVVDPDGKVLFDGPINTKEQKAKVPAGMMKWLDEVLSDKPRPPDIAPGDPFAPRKSD
jgi:hypothetical protein